MRVDTTLNGNATRNLLVTSTGRSETVDNLTVEHQRDGKRLVVRVLLADRINPCANLGHRARRESNVTLRERECAVELARATSLSDALEAVRPCCLACIGVNPRRVGVSTTNLADLPIGHRGVEGGVVVESRVLDVVGGGWLGEACRCRSWGG
jgi:hypothetical protein